MADPQPQKDDELVQQLRDSVKRLRERIRKSERLTADDLAIVINQ